MNLDNLAGGAFLCDCGNTERRMYLGPGQYVRAVLGYLSVIYDARRRVGNLLAAAIHVYFCVELRSYYRDEIGKG